MAANLPSPCLPKAAPWVVLLACACGSPARPPGTAPAKGALRDVVLVTIDTLRDDATGFSGAGKVDTPTLDRIARGGRVYTHAHAHAPMTLPSHASILTGLYPYRHGARDNAGFTLRRDVPTLASRLKDSGYATAAFVSAFPLDSRFGLGKGFDVYEDRYDAFARRVTTLAERPGDRTVALARDWWDSNRGHPRFLWVHLFEPHFPYEPPEPFASRYRGAPYYGEAAAADAYLAPLVDPILSEGAAGPILIFTSDHGEALGEHGEQTHGVFAYEETLKVPLVVRAPGLLEPGEDPTPARHVDILPTVLSLLKLPVPAALSGRDLAAPLPQGDDGGCYFEALTAYFNRGWAPLHGWLLGDRKAIDLPTPELYDLATDPKEARNLAPVQPEALRRLVARIPAEARSGGDRAAPDPEAIEMLRALGYAASASAAPPPSPGDPSTDPKRLIAREAEINEAVNRYRLGDASGGIRGLEAVLAREPRMAYLVSHLAFMYADQGRTADAVRLLSSAVARGIADERMVSTLAVGLLRTGKPEEAWKLLSRYGESLDPETQDALGTIAAALGRPDEARARFERAFALDPTYPSARVDLAVLLIHEGRHGEAKPALERALAENPSLPDGWNALGAVRAAEGDLRGAVEAWERAVRLNPKLSLALLNLATASARMGDFRRAAAALERLVPLTRGEERRRIETTLEGIRRRAAAAAP